MFSLLGDVKQDRGKIGGVHKNDINMIIILKPEF